MKIQVCYTFDTLEEAALHLSKPSTTDPMVHDISPPPMEEKMTVTKIDVRDAVARLLKEQGNEVVASTLNEYGAKRIGQIKEEDYERFIHQVRSMLK